VSPAEIAREQAAAVVAAAVAERDTIQANLLDLDGSFGKRLLAGAKLAGETRPRWDAAAVELTTLWETFTAYSAVVDRAAQALASAGRSPGPRLAEINSLLYAKSVRLTRPTSAVARGDLTATPDMAVTPAMAVHQMRRAFASVAGVTTAAETVWNALADQLQQVGADLDAAQQRGQGLSDDVLHEALALAVTDLAQLREVMNCDPLALWQHGQVDVTRLDRLRERAASAVSRVNELAALRENADRRITAVSAAVSAAADARRDAMAAQERASVKIAAAAPAPPPQVNGLADHVAALDTLKATGRWTRLAAELDLIEQQAAEAARAARDAEQEAAALLDRRNELRGLLDAYRARAAKLGGAEDSDLDARYDRARDLLWTAPCDLSAAGEAVTGYQQAVLALGRQGQRP
jgi:hypothetical protein